MTYDSERCLNGVKLNKCADFHIILLYLIVRDRATELNEDGQQFAVFIGECHWYVRNVDCSARWVIELTFSLQISLHITAAAIGDNLAFRIVVLIHKVIAGSSCRTRTEGRLRDCNRNTFREGYSKRVLRQTKWWVVELVDGHSRLIDFLILHHHSRFFFEEQHALYKTEITEYIVHIFRTNLARLCLPYHVLHVDDGWFEGFTCWVSVKR